MNGRTDRTRRGQALLIGWLAALALFACTTGEAQAGSGPALTPEQTLARTDAAVLAQVTKVTRRWIGAPHASSIATDYEFRVERLVADLTGIAARRTRGNVLTLSFFGGELDGESQRAHGVPTFDVGDRVFLLLNAVEEGAFSPLVGWWQGVYRVRGVGPAEAVVRQATCCGGERPVDRAFFADARRPGGFDARDFADELARALPIARARPELLRDSELPDAAPDAAGVAAGRGLGVCDIAPGRSTSRQPAPAEQSTLPPGPRPGALTVHTAPDGGYQIPTTVVVDETPRGRYGFSNGPQPRPIVFNVPPAMGGFRDAFIDSEGYWNIYAPDLFRFYASSNNSIGWPNSRNECGFLDQSQVDNLYGFTWGSAYGVCFTRTGFLSSNIAESDIAFNTAYTWTTDPQVGRTTAARLFQTVAVHELGHSFGLQHQWDSNPGATWLSVMNYYPANLTYNVGWIFADDSLAAAVRYGYSIFLNDIGVYLYANTGGRTGGNPNTNSITEQIYQFVNVFRGQPLPLTNVSIENSGTTGGSRTINWWLAPENGNLNNAIYLGSSTTPFIPGNRSARVSATPTVPVTTPVGNYYIAAQFTSNDDYNWNNTAWTRFTVRVDPNTPSNDASSNAIVLNPYGGTYFGTTLGATASIQQPCGGVGQYPDVWYRITAPFDGALEIDTCGSSYDTVLGLYTGGLSFIACNDDSAGGPCNGTRQSYIRLASATGGSSYLIRVGGFNGGTGDFALNVRFRPNNDIRCVSSGPFSILRPSASISGAGTVFGTTVGATRTDPGSGFQACNPLTFGGPLDVEPRADVWYQWTATCTGTVYITGSPVEQLWLTVYSGAACGSIFSNPTLVGCAGVYTGNIFSPGMTFNAVAGTSYWVRVRMIDTDGPFQLNFVPGNPVDGCAGWFGSAPPALTVDATTPTSVTVDTRCASPSTGLLLPADCAGPNAVEPGNDVWYSLAIQTSGVLNVTRCFGTYLPSVAFYSACSDNPFFPGQSTAFACGYSSSPSCDPIVLSTPVTAGQTIICRISGNTVDPGPSSGQTTITFTIVPPPVGACCAPDGTCVVSSAEECIGTYQGNDTVCDPNPCPLPLGACCVGVACSQTTEGDCAIAGGVWIGEGLPCLDEPGNLVTCCPANFDGANGLTPADIFTFLNAYFAQDPRSDFNNDGDRTPADIFAFLNAFFARCD
jgi:hypothetical protein